MICASGVTGRSLVFRSFVPIQGVISVLRIARSTFPSDSRRVIKLSSNFRRGIRTASMSNPAQSTASDSKAVNVVIKGTVQGVFYRKWTVDAAQKLGLNGWVRNCRDGSVEAVFSGPSSVVDDMVQRCHTGPWAAKVSSVDASKWDNEVPQGFEKKPTW